jgi:hypothetical protein
MIDFAALMEEKQLREVIAERDQDWAGQCY